MVNDLKPTPDLVKYVDDSTTWEVLPKNSQSSLSSIVSSCEGWTLDNNMKLNALIKDQIDPCELLVWLTFLFTNCD